VRWHSRRESWVDKESRGNQDKHQRKRSWLEQAHQKTQNKWEKLIFILFLIELVKGFSNGA